MKEKLEFRGGMIGLAVPFVVLLVGIAVIALKGWALPMAFWVPALGAMVTALLFSRKPGVTADYMVEGMSQPMVSINGGSVCICAVFDFRRRWHRGGCRYKCRGLFS